MPSPHSAPLTEFARLLAETRAGSPEALGQFGRFIIHQELGRGGFGMVFLAEDPHLMRLVAL